MLKKTTNLVVIKLYVSKTKLMKKILFFTFCFCFVQIVISQTEKGSFLIDATSNLGLYGDSPNTPLGLETDYYFTSEINTGYAVVNNLFLGISLDYNLIKNEIPEISYIASRSSAFYYGVFAKYFFQLKDNHVFRPYIFANYSFGIEKVSSQDRSSKVNPNRYALAVGSSIFLIPSRLSLDFDIRYISQEVPPLEGVIYIGDTNFSRFKTNRFSVGLSLFL